MPVKVTEHPGKPVQQDVEFDLAWVGYEQVEYLFEGVAKSYARRDETAPFTTRLIVRRPQPTARFSGTVVVEWLNAAAGIEVAPEWTILQRHLVRRGDAWIGVSAQNDGVDGGTQNLPSLKRRAPARYATLEHPGNEFSFDIFSLAGSTARSTGGGGLLPGRTPEHAFACGMSQSAAYLATYVRNVDADARVFDGFLIHSWVGVAPWIDGTRMEVAARRKPDTEAVRRALDAAPRTIPEDVRVPVIVLLTETDVLFLGTARERQPDSERVRTWEIAGTAHGDAYLIEGGRRDSGRLTPTDRANAFRDAGEREDRPNSAPQHHYVAVSAYEHLRWWAEGGPPPAKAPRLEFVAKEMRFAVDDTGNTAGGVRTPWVDAPVAVYSGLGRDGRPAGLGSTAPLPTDVLARLYPNGITDYVHRFSWSLDMAIAAGFLLPEDRKEILAFAPAIYEAETAG